MRQPRRWPRDAPKPRPTVLAVGAALLAVISFGGCAADAVDGVPCDPAGCPPDHICAGGVCAPGGDAGTDSHADVGPDLARPDAGDFPSGPDSGDAAVDLRDGSDANDVTDDGSDGADVSDADDPGLVAVEPPPAPELPERVETVTVTIATGQLEFNGTPNPVEVCLGDSLCFPFAIDEVETTERSAVTVLHRSVGGVDRASLDSVTVRIGGDNAWRPACIDVRLDGSPVQCADLTGTILSSDPDEAPSDRWTGPLREDCTTCQPATLTHGTVLGLPGEDRIRVWARADATRLVGLELSETEDGPMVPVAWAWPTPDTDFAATLDADGLAPGTKYWYRVTVGGEPGPVLSLATAPAADAEVSIGVGSCAKHPDQHPAMFAQLQAKPMDAFLFVGDTHYGNAQNRQAHWHYIRQLRAIDERSSFFSQVPVAAVWDDHDFLGNNSNSSCRGADEALHAFRSYWPNPEFGTAEAAGVYFRHRFGPAELFMLDCRYHRPDVGDIARGCETQGQGNTDMGAGPLGQAQFQWLLDGLASSSAAFKVVSCGSLVSGDSVDSWFSFPAAKERLLTQIHARGVSGVVFVSGDIHRSEAKVIARDDGYDFVEVVSSPLAQYPRAGFPRTQCNTPREGRLYCDAYNSFVVMRVDGRGEDPEFQALYYDEFGEQRFALVRRLSELTNR